MPAKYWRFVGGLQDAPEPEQPTPCQQIMGGWNCVQNLPPPWMYGGYPPWQVPGWQPPPAFLPGPIYIKGLRTPPPAYGAVSPPPPDAEDNLPPPPPTEDKKDEKKEKKKNPGAPLKMPEGCNYMFDKDHTMLHIFGKTYPVWEEKYQKGPQKFKIFKVSVNFTVKMVIEHVKSTKGDACDGWAATEVFELGRGKWAKGSTHEYDNGKSDSTLKALGWSIKRGDKLPPVWLVVHKV